MTPSDETSTKHAIAAAALKVLREQGASGLSMRQVARCSGLVLSNVQYHYRNREQLLIGLTEVHISRCTEVMSSALGHAEEPTLREIIEASLLDESVREVAQTFRELFALALHQPAVQQRLDEYYHDTHAQLAEFLVGYSGRPEPRCREAAAVLLATIEGAYLIGDAMSVGRAEMVDRVEAMTLALLQLAPGPRGT
ncbi:MAG: TetR/AcrR family transcriptional regulator [Myxococcota bacterium]